MLTKGYRVFRNDGKGKNNPAITQPVAKKETAQKFADRMNEMHKTDVFYVYSWTNPFDVYGRRDDFYG